MVILVDANIVLDVLLKREPYRTNAEVILSKCAGRQIIGYLAAHTIPNVFYILRKGYTHQERRRLIKNLCSIFRISELNLDKILSAIDNEDFTDFEDCLQEECAVNVMADYIVTRNIKDYERSKVQAILSAEFIKIVSQDK